MWSWLYVLVEMLDGGLCWRIGKDKADRRVEDASRHLNSKHMDAEKQKKKEIALKRKQAALTDPDLLTGNVVLPGAEQVLMPLQSVLNHNMCNKYCMPLQCKRFMQSIITRRTGTCHFCYFVALAFEGCKCHVCNMQLTAENA